MCQKLCDTEYEDEPQRQNGHVQENMLEMQKIPFSDSLKYNILI